MEDYFKLMYNTYMMKKLLLLPVVLFAMTLCSFSQVEASALSIRSIAPAPVAITYTTLQQDAITQLKVFLPLPKDQLALDNLLADIYGFKFALRGGSAIVYPVTNRLQAAVVTRLKTLIVAPADQALLDALVTDVATYRWAADTSIVP